MMEKRTLLYEKRRVKNGSNRIIQGINKQYVQLHRAVLEAYETVYMNGKNINLIF